MFESPGFDSSALGPKMEEVRGSATMNAGQSSSLSDPARPISPQSRRANLSPLRENPNSSNLLQEISFEEDLEKEECWNIARIFQTRMNKLLSM